MKLMLEIKAEQIKERENVWNDEKIEKHNTCMIKLIKKDIESNLLKQKFKLKKLVYEKAT